MSDRPDTSATEGLGARHGAFGDATASIDEWTAQYRRVLAERSDRWLSAARGELGDVFASFDGSDAPASGDWLGENRNLQRVSMAVAVEGIMGDRAQSSAEVDAQPAGANRAPEPLRRPSYHEAMSRYSDERLTSIVGSLSPELEPVPAAVARAQAEEPGVRRRLARAENKVHELTTQVQVLEHLHDPRVTERRTELWTSEYERETLERALGEIETSTEGVTQKVLDDAERRAAAVRELATRENEAAMRQKETASPEKETTPREPEAAQRVESRAALGAEGPGFG